MVEGMKRIGRRQALHAGGAAVLATLSACGSNERDSASAQGPVAATRAGLQRRLVRDPLGLLELPEGFRVRVVQRTGERMSDGFRVPGRPDAMACFASPNGNWVLMRNHELAPQHYAIGPFDAGQSPPAESYDPAGLGGVSRVEIDPATLNVVRSNLVLAGTHINCAGGTSPWGWLTCEETIVDNHGYVFLCATDATSVQAPRRIDAFGRFNHEAATIDPATSIAYLTEDRVDGSFYRCLPKSKDTPLEGALQAMRVKRESRLDTGALKAGAVVEIDWVDVPEPCPADDSVRTQAQERGAAIIRRGEGLWLAGSDIYLSATIGGALERGQIFRLRTDKSRLEVICEATAQNDLDMPDNLTVSPHGPLYVCEDGYDGNSVRRVTLDGQMIEFARNVASASELTGICFSPDGRVMFLNLQTDGITLAVEGPFESALRHDARRALGQGSERLATVSSGLALLALTALARRKRALR
jgi:secreted PhoX family phosphatase